MLVLCGLPRLTEPLRGTRSPLPTNALSSVLNLTAEGDKMRGSSPRIAWEPSSAPSPGRVEPWPGSSPGQDPSPVGIDLRPGSSRSPPRPRAGSRRGAPSGGEWALVPVSRTGAAARMKFPGSVLISLVLFVSETAAALCLSVKYRDAGDRMWQILTLFFALMPCVLMQLSLVFIHRDVSRDRPLVLLLHLLQLGPLIRSVSPCCLQRAGAGAGAGAARSPPAFVRCGRGRCRPAPPGAAGASSAAAGGTGENSFPQPLGMHKPAGDPRGKGLSPAGPRGAGRAPSVSRSALGLHPCGCCRWMSLFAAASSTALCSQVTSKREREDFSLGCEFRTTIVPIPPVHLGTAVML